MDTQLRREAALGPGEPGVTGVLIALPRLHRQQPGPPRRPEPSAAAKARRIIYWETSSITRDTVAVDRRCLSMSRMAMTASSGDSAPKLGPSPADEPARRVGIPLGKHHRHHLGKVFHHQGAAVDRRPRSTEHSSIWAAIWSKRIHSLLRSIRSAILEDAIGRQ